MFLFIFGLSWSIASVFGVSWSIASSCGLALLFVLPSWRGDKWQSQVQQKAQHARHLAALLCQELADGEGAICPHKEDTGEVEEEPMLVGKTTTESQKCVASNCKLAAAGLAKVERCSPVLQSHLTDDWDELWCESLLIPTASFDAAHTMVRLGLCTHCHR